MTDDEIDFTDIPEITEEDMRDAVLRVGAQPIPEGKSVVGVLLDSDVVEYFRRRAGDSKLQTLINETLRASMAKA